jgi:hypothetical protein
MKSTGAGGRQPQFGLDRRWVTLAVAVALGASGGSLLGFLSASSRADDAASTLSPPETVAPSATRRPRSRLAGVSSTSSSRPRPGYPAVTAGLRPATTTASTVRATTTTTSTTQVTTTTTGPTTTTGATTTSSSSSTTSTSLVTSTTR